MIDIRLVRENPDVIRKDLQKRKDEEIFHPFLKEKITVGLLPFVQARLLARWLRGDGCGAKRLNQAFAGWKTTLRTAHACQAPRNVPNFLDNENSVFGSGALA